MARVLDDVDLRGALSEEGRRGRKRLLKWDSERARLLAAYDMALAQPGNSRSVPSARPARG